MSKVRERWPYKRDPNIFPPIKPEYAQGVGYVAMHWSMVEEQLATAIRFLLNLTPLAEIALLSEVPTLTRMTMIRSLLEVGGDAELSGEWDSLAAEMDILRGRRNDTVHGIWQPVEPSHYLKRAKAKSRLKLEFGPVDIGVLTKLSDDILEFSDKFVSFVSAIIHSDAQKRLADHFLVATGARTPALALSTPSQPQPRAKPRSKKPSSAQRRALAKKRGAAS